MVGQIRRHRSVILAGLLVAGVAWAISVSGAIGTESYGTSHAPSLQNPTYAACINSRKVVCNPQAYQTDVAGNPVAQRPDPRARLMARNDAIALARTLAASEYTPAAPPSAPAFARIMTEREFEALQPGGVDSFANLQRLFWVVTVHAPTSATDRQVQYFKAYTVQIDAETGRVYRVCLGCDSVRS